MAQMRKSAPRTRPAMFCGSCRGLEPAAKGNRLSLETHNRLDHKITTHGQRFSASPCSGSPAESSNLRTCISPPVLRQVTYSHLAQAEAPGSAPSRPPRHRSAGQRRAHDQPCLVAPAGGATQKDGCVCTFAAVPLSFISAIQDRRIKHIVRHTDGTGEPADTSDTGQGRPCRPVRSPVRVVIGRPTSPATTSGPGRTPACSTGPRRPRGCSGAGRRRSARAARRPGP